MTALHQLRETLELRFPEAMPIARGLAPALTTGVGALDGALPNRGLPRGCLTVWRGGAGASALLRSACVEAVGRGERAAWVDGAGMVLGDFWPRGVVMVRPRRRPDTLNTCLNTRPDTLRTLAAGEELLRSGGFALVVVAGVPPGLEAELVRLSRVAREGGAALVVVERAPGGRARAPAVPAARLKVESWYRPDAHVWREGAFGEPVEVVSMGVVTRVTGTGWLRTVNLQLPVQDHAYRLSLDPGLVDRRGVGRRASGVGEVRLELESAQGGPDAGRGERAAVEQVVQPVGGSVQSLGGGGLAGAGEAGGGAAGGGAAPADRGSWPGLGRRAWPGRAPLRRGAALAAG